MLFVKLKTFHHQHRGNNARRMPASVAKWVNLTAMCGVFFLTVVLLPPANGFTPIGGFQNGEGRKLFGGYRITPKHCRGTKTLPVSDPRSKGPTICMFNHECAQRNGEVVGACMDGFLFGACCQVPQSNANENTLIKDAQNPSHQTNSHSTEGYDPALYGSSQKFESNEFQEIQTKPSRYEDLTTTESSYLQGLTSQKIHKVNKTSSSSNKIFYVNKGSVMVSSPSSISHNDDYVMLSSSTGQPLFTGGNHNKVSFTTELPMKISTDLVDNEDSTQLPIILSETAQIKRNYSSGPLDLDVGEFTHSDITHPGAESVLIDNDLQFSTGFGGPQSVYVPPPAHAEIIPPKRRPAHRPSSSGPSKKPSNDKYVLIQTLEASKKPSQATGTTSTGISTNIDSIESIILMLNGTSHGPSYNVGNTSPSYNQQKPSYQQNQGFVTTYKPGGQTYTPITTSRPIVTVTTGSGVDLSDNVASTTPEPVYYDEADTRRPTTTYFQESTEQTSNKYHSVEMSDEKTSFVELPSPPNKFVSDKVDSQSPVGPSQSSYNVATAQLSYENNVDSHKDASNPDYGYTSPGQPTSDFNKMPAVGEAYPVMDEETSAYFESSMLSEEQASSQNSEQTDEVSDKNIPIYPQASQQQQQQQQQQENHQQYRPVQQTGDNKIHQTQEVYYDDGNQNQNNNPQNQEYQKRPQSNNRPQLQQVYQQVSHTRPSSQPPTNDYQEIIQKRPSPPTPSQVYQQMTNSKPPSQQPIQNYEQVVQHRPVQHTSTQKYEQISQAGPSSQRPYIQKRPSSQRPPQDYEELAQTSYLSHSTSSHIHTRPTAQILTTSFEVQSPTPRPGTHTYNGFLSHSPSTHIIKPTTSLVTQTYQVEDQDSYISSTSRPTQGAQEVTQSYDSPEANEETYQTPESQLIAQLTNHIKNGYLSNSRPTQQIIIQDHYNENYLSRPTPQSTKVQAGYFDGNNQSRPIAIVTNQNNQVQVQAGYFSQPPPRPTIPPTRISTLIVQQQSTARPTKPSNVQTALYSDVETNYPTQSQDQSTVSSTSKPVKPVKPSSTARPSKRPTKRVTKRPSNQKKPASTKVPSAQQSTQTFNQPPPQKFSGTPPNISNKPITSKPSNVKKQPPSTSYVTGPTTPRPEDIKLSQNQYQAAIADKVDTFSTSTKAPGYNSIYIASPTDEIILQSAPTNSNHQSYNKPLFVKIPSATQKPPSPTVIITPKPTVVNLITASSSSKRPTTTPSPTFAGSNSYIYSPLITRRPEYASSTQEYVSIPQVTSNDFDDPGYSGLHTHTTQVLNKIPTDDRPSFPGYYGPTPSYPTFQLPSDKYGDAIEEEEETNTSPNDFVNFPPVRNPNLNMSATSSSVTSDLELSTPAFVEDIILKDKMNTLVHKIVESLQGNFEALADMIDETNNTAAGFSGSTLSSTTLVTRRPTTKPSTRKPTTKPSSPTKPTRVSTRKPPTRLSTPVTTKRPTVVTRRPAVTTRKPSTRKPSTRKPTRKATTTTARPVQDEFVDEEEDANNNEVDSNIGEDNTEGERKFQCGVRPHVKSGRIVGGKGSTFGEFPWQVLVRESTWLGLFTKNKCGGVLITNKYVITAAHCQPGFLASLVAVMGEFDISGDLEAKRSVTKNVKRVIVHRQYDPATFENDLALLELESPVNYDTHIVPICMPADTADFTGRMATVTGWGRLKYGGGVPSVLQEVQVPIIENSVCQEMFHTAGHNKKILQSFLCAGYANGQKDSCEGDSGGPLVLQRPDGRYELAGTVSHGIKCAAPYLPGVYMRTTFYKPWLRSITGVK